MKKEVGPCLKGSEVISDRVKSHSRIRAIGLILRQDTLMGRGAVFQAGLHSSVKEEGRSHGKGVGHITEKRKTGKMT